MNDKFLVIDVEMANNNITSICQIGLAVFQGGKLNYSWESLINPDGDFGYYQTRVHGITKEHVANSPKLADVAGYIRSLIEDQTVFSYGMSDCSALMDSLPLPQCVWSDASQVARRTWDYGKNRRKLEDACTEQGIIIKQAHHALSDAVATGELMVQAMLKHNRELKYLLNFSKKNITTQRAVQDGLF